MEAFLIVGWVAIHAAACSHISLETKNWLNAITECLFIEFNNARHGAMVGHCDRFHALFFDVVNKIRNLRKAVEKAVVSMVVQMHKIFSLECSRLINR